MGIRPDQLSALQRGGIIVNVIHRRPDCIQGSILHVVNIIELIPAVGIQHRNSVGDAAISHIVVPVSAFHQTYIYGIGSGTDEVFPDLLIGSTDCGDDGNDSGDTNDNAQHRQQGTQLVSPDSLKR